ncbi:MAG: hypothetical protein NWE84_03550, partial [Candidatus Bathyarchaeota archaeon]|nr:hypothetical protein [Candidatus Bathyarchaeota archaeon]
VVLALGISVCLIGAFLMAFGEGLLADNLSGITSVMGIVGVGFIGTAGAMLSAGCAVRTKTKN